jgi:hypothetical protein
LCGLRNDLGVVYSEDFSLLQYQRDKESALSLFSGNNLSISDHLLLCHYEDVLLALDMLLVTMSVACVRVEQIKIKLAD